MNRTAFACITQDIEHAMAGEDYEIAVEMRSGSRFAGAWRHIGPGNGVDPTAASIIVLSIPDIPPIYLDINEIAAITVAHDDFMGEREQEEGTMQ